MGAPLELTSLTKVFTTAAGPFVAVKDVNVEVAAGEFDCILGHSGCGKSTALSFIAGLDVATLGGVVIDGKEGREPGADRGVVFQGRCLLPWLTARDNVTLAIGRDANMSHRRRREQAEHYLQLVGVSDVANELPAGLSLGTQQGAPPARALASGPRFLLLDEPFSQLDSLTRFELQDTLLRVWEASRRVVVMVTHVGDGALNF